MPSTVIHTVYYNKEEQVLKVVFQSGAVYLYRDVPDEVYLLLMKARSKGTFLNRFIKENYVFERME